MTKTPDTWQAGREAKQRLRRRRCTRTRPWTAVNSSSSSSSGSRSVDSDNKPHRPSNDAEKGERLQNTSSVAMTLGGSATTMPKRAAATAAATAAAAPKTDAPPLPAAGASAGREAEKEEGQGKEDAENEEEAAEEAGRSVADPGGETVSASSLGGGELPRSDKQREEGDGFGEHGWYSPAGAAEVGVG